MSWISPRIWRCPKSRFNDDEPLNCAAVYTPEVLRGIRDQGFDAIWMRGRLWDLIRSEIYPELNDADAEKRVANLRKVIADGKDAGVKVYLYFNEPLGFPAEYEFWKHHPALVGEPHVEFETGETVLAFCTSTPQFKEFFNESLENLFGDIEGLGGVILITASEYHSHCWSHRPTRPIGDAHLDKSIGTMKCPNCKDREPADVVAELVDMWKTAADAVSPSLQVWAWNWSWSMWYDQTQREVIEKLPDGVKLMCDFERGGVRQQGVGEVFIDEYSLGYVGPSERFVESIQAAQARNIDVCGKLQIGTTHEIATVPNIPLIPNLFEKLSRIDKLGLDGLMFSWNFGNSPSVNTAAINQFVARADLRTDREAFCETLAADYFSTDSPETITAAWKKFCESFKEFPFSLKMLYFGPVNYSVAYPLLLDYTDRPMGPSWIWHEPFGDRLDDCLGPFSLEQICESFGKMLKLWSEGLELYREVLTDKNNRNQVDELSTAEMIACHLAATKNIFDFQAWRKQKMKEQNLTGPCRLTVDALSQAIMQRHVAVLQQAMKMVEKDSRFGYHQEPQVYFYTPESIVAVISKMLE